MADTYLTPAHINPKIDVFGTSQHFNFYEQFNSFVFFNKFTPTSLLNTSINIDFKNSSFGGFRFKYTKDYLSSVGNFSFNYFLDNDYVGIPLFTANENGIFFNINAKGNTPLLNNDFVIKSYVDNKVFDLTNNTSGELSVSRLTGYPANSSFFLRGDGQWANAVTQFPVTVTTSNSSLEVITTYNSNPSAYGTGIGFYNQNNNGIMFGVNNSTSEGYVWATNNISLKFATNNILRMQIYTNGTIDCFSNNLNTTGAITGQNIYSNSAIDAPNIYASNSFIGNNWSSYTLPYIYINSPVNNLTLYSDLKLNGNRITDSNGLHKMSFVGGTLEVSSGITTGRYYSYGWLNSSGGTGAASGTNFYSIVCQDRIAASEFNAISSKKIKKIIPNLDIQDLKQKFLNINFCQYNYIDESDGKGNHYGVIAEDLSLIFPQFVDLEKERYIPNCIDEHGRMMKICFKGKEKDIYKFSHKLDLNKIDKEAKYIRLFINGSFYKTFIDNITTKKLYVYFENDDKMAVDNYFKNNKVIYAYGTYEKCPTVEKNKLFEIGLILLQETLKKIN